jgi:GTP-binding protein YchF
MEVGIVGLPNVGKSTLFNALTGQQVEADNYPFQTTRPHVGLANIPDARLATINRSIQTQKIVHTALQLADMPALVRGASEGEGMGNQFLADVRNVDAILHVVRCFTEKDVPHVDGSVDPQRDIETIDLELIAADAAVVANAIAKAQKLARTGDKAATARLEALQACQARLSELKPVRSASLTDAQLRELRSFALLTAKPVLYIANVDEDDPDATGPSVQKVHQHAAEQGGEVVTVCAKIESELAELDAPDRAEMLASLGMTEPALATVAGAAYELLGLQSFYTAGPKEIRAWTVRRGATAPEAAGAVHSDIERGFIRAEIYHVDDLAAYGSEAAIKAAGKLRVEGKHYVMQDGDVCHFLFNV